MAVKKEVVLTQTGLKNLESELVELRTVRRKEVAEKIKEARGQGDLSENAEYDAAKDEQAQVESRIAVIENMLRNARIIDEDDINRDVINLGSTITLFDEEFDEEVEYSLVGSAEANPMQGRISNESPLGNALIGHKKGDVVEFEAPSGVLKYKVLNIV